MANGRTPRISGRALAIIAALAVTAAACGDSTVTADSPETTAAPTTTTVPDTTTSTLADPSATSTVAPESSTTTAVPSLQEFAIPAGPTLREVTTVAELEELGSSLLGPTDDMAAVVARLVPFPNVPTFTDTELIRVDGEYTNEFENDQIVVESLTISATLEGLTPATREDVEIAFQTSLAAAGFEQTREGSNRFELPNGEGRLDLSTRNDDGDTRFVVDYLLFTDPDPALVEATTQWAQGGPWADGVLQSSGIAANASIDSYEAIIRHRFEGQTQDDLRVSEATRLAESDWVAVGEIINQTQIGIEGGSGAGSVSYVELDDDGVPFTTQWFRYGDDV